MLLEGIRKKGLGTPWEILTEEQTLYRKKIWLSAQDILMMGVARFPEDALLHFQLACFYYFHTGNKPLAHREFSTTGRLKCAFDMKFLLFLFRTRSKETDSAEHSAEVKSYIEFKDLCALAESTARLAARTLLDLWTELGRATPNIERVLRMSHVSRSSLMTASQSYDRLLVINPSSVQILRAYGGFVLDFLGDISTSAHMLHRADELEEIRSCMANSDTKELKLLAIQKTNLDVYDERNAVFSVSLDSANFAQIISVNAAARRIFGYSLNSELLGHNINTIIPEPARSAHDEILTTFLYSNQPRMIGATRVVLAVHKLGHVLPLDANIRWADTTASRVIGVLAPVNTPDEQIIFDKTVDHVTYSTLNAYATFGFTREMIVAKEVQVSALFPHLSVEHTQTAKGRRMREEAMEQSHRVRGLVVAARNVANDRLFLVRVWIYNIQMHTVYTSVARVSQKIDAEHLRNEENLLGFTMEDLAGRGALEHDLEHMYKVLAERKARKARDEARLRAETDSSLLSLTPQHKSQDDYATSLPVPLSTRTASFSSLSSTASTPSSRTVGPPLSKPSLRDQGGSSGMLLPEKEKEKASYLRSSYGGREGLTSRALDDGIVAKGHGTTAGNVASTMGPQRASSVPQQIAQQRRRDLDMQYEDSLVESKEEDEDDDDDDDEYLDDSREDLVAFDPNRLVRGPGGSTAGSSQYSDYATASPYLGRDTLASRAAPLVAHAKPGNQHQPSVPSSSFSSSTSSSGSASHVALAVSSKVTSSSSANSSPSKDRDSHVIDVDTDDLHKTKAQLRLEASSRALGLSERQKMALRAAVGEDDDDNAGGGAHHGAGRTKRVAPASPIIVSDYAQRVGLGSGGGDMLAAAAAADESDGGVSENTGSSTSIGNENRAAGHRAVVAFVKSRLDTVSDKITFSRRIGIVIALIIFVSWISMYFVLDAAITKNNEALSTQTLAAHRRSMATDFLSMSSALSLTVEGYYPMSDYTDLVTRMAQALGIFKTLNVDLAEKVPSSRAAQDFLYKPSIPYVTKRPDGQVVTSIVNFQEFSHSYVMSGATVIGTPPAQLNLKDSPGLYTLTRNGVENAPAAFEKAALLYKDYVDQIYADASLTVILVLCSAITILVVYVIVNMYRVAMYCEHNSNDVVLLFLSLPRAVVRSLQRRYATALKNLGDEEEDEEATPSALKNGTAGGTANFAAARIANDDGHHDDGEESDVSSIGGSIYGDDKDVTPSNAGVGTFVAGAGPGTGAGTSVGADPGAHGMFTLARHRVSAVRQESLRQMNNLWRLNVSVRVFLVLAVAVIYVVVVLAKMNDARASNLGATNDILASTQRQFALVNARHSSRNYMLGIDTDEAFKMTMDSYNLLSTYMSAIVEGSHELGLRGNPSPAIYNHLYENPCVDSLTTPVIVPQVKEAYERLCTTYHSGLATKGGQELLITAKFLTRLIASDIYRGCLAGALASNANKTVPYQPSDTFFLAARKIANDYVELARDLTEPVFVTATDLYRDDAHAENEKLRTFLMVFFIIGCIVLAVVLLVFVHPVYYGLFNKVRYSNSLLFAIPPDVTMKVPQVSAFVQDDTFIAHAHGTAWDTNSNNTAKHQHQQQQQQQGQPAALTALPS